MPMSRIGNSCNESERNDKAVCRQIRSDSVICFFGLLTTLVNYAVYIPCLNILKLSRAVSNIIAWIAAVAFAFLTNKRFVFRSGSWAAAVVMGELAKFLGTRVGSGLAETLLIWLMVDTLGQNGILWKLLTNAAVLVINYIGSCFFVFKKQQ